MDSDDNEGYVRLKVIRGSVDSVSLFEITDYELEILEKGSPSSTYFNFSIFFLSVGLSFLVTLASAEISSNRLFIVFVIITLFGLSAGTVLLVLWSRFRSSTADVCKRIRARVPSEDSNSATGEGLGPGDGNPTESA